MWGVWSAYQRAADSAAWFWWGRELNALADRDKFEAITREINGGLYGLPDRLELWTGRGQYYAFRRPDCGTVSAIGYRLSAIGGLLAALAGGSPALAWQIQYGS